MGREFKKLNWLHHTIEKSHELEVCDHSSRIILRELKSLLFIKQTKKTQLQLQWIGSYAWMRVRIVIKVRLTNSMRRKTSKLVYKLYKTVKHFVFFVAYLYHMVHMAHLFLLRLIMMNSNWYSFERAKIWLTTKYNESN